MSDDLVKRLLVCASDQGGWIYKEAANRIEELQEIIIRIQHTNLRRDMNRDERTKEIDKLCRRE